MKIINNITNVKIRIIFILWNQHYGNKLERMRKKRKINSRMYFISFIVFI